MMSDILQKILSTKAEEIRQDSQKFSLASLKSQCEDVPDTRGFVSAIKQKIANQNPAIISEIKKASPSQGLICDHFSPAKIAQSYARNGATCLSILTDEHYFQGHNDYLAQARNACHLPVLRKDFIINLYQVYQSRVIGADAILLIVAALGDALLLELCQLADDLHLDVLVEVHDASELERALKLPCSLIGINNRNLRTFETSLQTTLNLLDLVSKERIIITESGIHTTEDVQLMRDNNVYGFLVGEAFMRTQDPGRKLKQLFGGW